MGSGYEALKRKYARLHERMEKGASAAFTDSESSESDGGGEGETEESKEGARSRGASEDFEKKRHRKTKADVEREALEKGDLYALLGLEKLKFEAGEGDIGKAYKKFALKYHPDKLGDSITEQDKEMWLKVQEAYETLSDPVKRRRYDSSLPFDERIPREGDWSEATFFEVFAACFTLNSMWAKKKPVPSLGDDETPLSEVKKFYKYWDNFQSWREFSQYDEYNLEEAQDRYERRYMEKENKKLRAEHEKKERARIITLTERCYNNDPRIRREREAAEAERQRKKDEKKAHRAERHNEKAEMHRQIEERKQAEAD